MNALAIQVRSMTVNNSASIALVVSHAHVERDTERMRQMLDFVWVCVK